MKWKDLKVLVVDDHLNMRRTISNMLKSHGFQTVVEAPDGTDALVKLEEGGIDVVVCDWNMPKMKGVNVLQWMRSHDATKETPFLMVTAEVDEKTVMQALEGEVDGYIIKPFKAQTLTDKLNSILERREKPTPIEMHIKTGMAHLNSGSTKQAIAEFKKALLVDSLSPRSHYHLGLAHEKNKDFKSAVRSMKKSAELAPQYIKAFEGLHRVLRAVGKNDEALEALAQAIALSPINQDRQLTLGKELLKAGRVGEAKEVMTQARKLFPEDAGLASGIGEAYMEAGLHAEAEEAFGSALNINPSMRDVYNRLGIAYRKQGKVKEAITNYQQALKISPNDENLYYNLGVAFLEGKDKKSAAKALSVAVKLNPNFSQAQELLERLG